MKNPEIILNLWLIGTEDGWVGSLRVHPYLGTGTEEEKLAFLKSRAGLDYMVARMFEIPAAYRFRGATSGAVVNAAFMPAVNAAGPTIQLFEEALQEVASSLPASTPHDVSSRPLACITYVAKQPDGTLRAIES